MGEGFIGDIDSERRIVAGIWFSGVISLALINVLDTESGGYNFFLVWWAIIAIMAPLIIILFSVIKTTGRNGEWIWFALSITTGGVSTLYYLLDWLNIPLVEGA